MLGTESLDLLIIAYVEMTGRDKPDVEQEFNCVQTEVCKSPESHTFESHLGFIEKHILTGIWDEIERSKGRRYIETDADEKLKLEGRIEGLQFAHEYAGGEW